MNLFPLSFWAKAAPRLPQAARDRFSILIAGVLLVFAESALIPLVFIVFVRRPDSPWVPAVFAALALPIGVMIYGAVGMIRLRRRVRSTDGAICPQCGYATHGLENKFVCPECGRSDTQEAVRAAWKDAELI
jgi:hypothetical protein